jgi:hypothetical protein
MKPDPRPLHTDVAQLPADLRQLVEQMLADGATFEDVVEAVAARGGAGVTLAAVETFFRGNLALQQERVRRQVEAARALKKALGNSGSSQARLAEAALLTGLMRLNRKGSEISFRDVMRARAERSNLHLKQQLLRLKVRKAVQDREWNRARLRAERARWRLTKLRIVELQRALQTEGKPTGISPEILQKIQEIYGLVTLPTAPAVGQKTIREARSAE